MKLDPNQACANEREKKLWAILHDGVAHPLMVLSNYSAWSLRFHDWTSRKAWPRAESSFQVYVFAHPKVAHNFVTAAATEGEAKVIADKWFQSLAEEFGGQFDL